MSTNPLQPTNTSQDTAAGYAVVVRPFSIFDTEPDLMLYRDRWLQRCARYEKLRAYYTGTIYNDPRWRALLHALGLYAGVRGIFAPLKRAVKVDVAKVPGAWKLPDSAPANLARAIELLRQDSGAEAAYARAVLYGAVAGEFGLLVRDDWRARQIHMIALRPDEVVTGQRADGAPFGLIIKRGLVDRAGVYEYAQLITPRTIATYRNGALYDYDAGNAIRPNLLGHVPLLLAPYIAGEDGSGECSFSGAEEQLDRVNDATSQALDVVQRNAEPLLVISGVNETEIDQEDNALVLTKDTAKAYTVAPNLVIDQVLALIQEVKGEFKATLPQLIFDVLQSRNDLAYDTVLTLCSELIDHVTNARRQVDAAIVQAEQWAIVAGQAMRLPQYAGIDPKQHKLDSARAVIQPTPAQLLQLEQQKLAIEKRKRDLTQPQQPQAPQQPQQPRDQADQAAPPQE